MSDPRLEYDLARFLAIIMPSLLPNLKTRWDSKPSSGRREIGVESNSRGIWAMYGIIIED